MSFSWLAETIYSDSVMQDRRVDVPVSIPVVFVVGHTHSQTFSEMFTAASPDMHTGAHAEKKLFYYKTTNKINIPALQANVKDPSSCANVLGLPNEALVELLAIVQIFQSLTRTLAKTTHEQQEQDHKTCLSFKKPSPLLLQGHNYMN